jgi:hypothetical protein
MGWAKDIARMLGTGDEHKFLFEILKKKKHFVEMDLGLKIKDR